MRFHPSRRAPIVFAALLLAVLVVPAAFAAAPSAPAAPAPQAAASTQCTPNASVLTDIGLSSALLEAVTPHCCSQQEIDACRSGCRDVGPGCKGQIACRAGECDCACVCP